MQLKTNHYVIILLVLVTAVLHLAAAFDRILFPAGVPDPLFLLNGLGYLGLLGAFFLPIPFFQQRHKLVWQVLFGADSMMPTLQDWRDFQPWAGKR